MICSAVVTCRQTDRQTDIAKRVGAFLQIFSGDTPKEYTRKELNNNSLSGRPEEYRDT
jgi:hypothetical protein